MIECTAGLMCGTVRSRPGGPVQKVVAAGGDGGGYLSTVEIYDLDSNMWTKGWFNVSVTKITTMML